MKELSTEVRHVLHFGSEVSGAPAGRPLLPSSRTIFLLAVAFEELVAEFHRLNITPPPPGPQDIDGRPIPPGRARPPVVPSVEDDGRSMAPERTRPSVMTQNAGSLSYDRICHQFLREGRCGRGRKCKYAHVVDFAGESYDAQGSEHPRARSSGARRHERSERASDARRPRREQHPDEAPDAQMRTASGGE